MSNVIEVHNCWTIYGLEADGSRAETPFAAGSTRPQDWGDRERWTYHRFRYEWQTAPDPSRPHWINNAHCWTDLKLETHEYPTLFSSLVSQIMWPGKVWQLCGDQFLHEDDFWRESWGPMPPFYEGPEEDWSGPPPGFELKPADEAEAIAMMGKVFENPFEVIIQTQGFDLFQLIGLIQFATRGLPANHRLHGFARHIGDQMAEALVLATGEQQLAEYIKLGWNPAFDVVQRDGESND